MWVHCKWRLQSSHSPSLSRGAAPTQRDVGSWHTRQHFAKPLYAPGHLSPISFTLPCLCVSVTTNQVRLSVIINVQYWIFNLSLPALTGEKKRSSSALTLCLQLSC